MVHRNRSVQKYFVPMDKPRHGSKQYLKHWLRSAENNIDIANLLFNYELFVVLIKYSHS